MSANGYGASTRARACAFRLPTSASRKPYVPRFSGPTLSRAGSDIGFGIPGVGVVYPRNLTPDPDTGLGTWTEQEILRALRQGQSKDGRPLIPIMPWPSYSVLTDADATALVAYLKSLKPVRFPVPPNAKAGEKAPAPYLAVVEPK